MSIIIRLQNLPWSANAADIRTFFHGLSIPEGGVHIVGGELGDAFIAFSTDEDARQAFNRNNGKIKGVQITLMLSSRTEMQRVIEHARAQSFAAFMQTNSTNNVPVPAPVPAMVPQIKEMRRDNREKEKSEKRESRRRSRSRSKSRDRRDRSKDRRDRDRNRSKDRRDRRRNKRSRSRSRDRKTSRRRDKSRSRGRSNSHSSRDQRRNSPESSSSQQKDAPKPVEVWAKQKPLEIIPPMKPPNLLGVLPMLLNQPNRSFDNLNPGINPQRNGGPPVSQFDSRKSWPPSNNVDDSFQRNSNFRRERDSPIREFRNRVLNRGPNSRFEQDNCSIAIEPFCGGYGEVRRFFRGMFIGNTGIKFINDANGRSTGVVYIRFSSGKFREEALTMNGKFMAGARLKISPISEEEFDAASDRYIPDDYENSSSGNHRNVTKYFNRPGTNTDIKNFSCLIVDDLPTYCKEQDILHMFSVYPLLSLILTMKKRGGYIAYVKFSTQEGARQALDESDLHIVGGKQVTVTPCTDSEFDEINKKHEVNLNATKKENIGTECLSVSGLPEKTNDKDIADFFSDIGVIPTKIHLISTNLGFTGQAYCEFLTVEEASRAARKHESVLGNEIINVLAIKREEMEAILGNTVPEALSLSDSKPPPPGPKISNSQDIPEIKDLVDLEEELHNQRPQIPPLVGSGSLLPPFVVPNNGRPAFPSRPFDMRGDDMRGGDVRGGDVRGGDVRGGDVRGGDMRGGPRFGPRGFGQPRPRFVPPKDVFDDVPPGCTLFMNNVPYKANTNDILNFFDGYNHTNNVSRRYNPNNTPSDEAKITFFDPEEAARAVRDLHKAKIWERQIFLRQE